MSYWYVAACWVVPPFLALTVSRRNALSYVQAMFSPANVPPVYASVKAWSASLYVRSVVIFDPTGPCSTFTRRPRRSYVYTTSGVVSE